MDHIRSALHAVFKENSYNNTTVDHYIITEIVTALSGPLVSFKDTAKQKMLTMKPLVYALIVENEVKKRGLSVESFAAGD